MDIENENADDSPSKINECYSLINNVAIVTLYIQMAFVCTNPVINKSTGFRL